MSTLQKRIGTIAIIVAALLMIPFIAMWFTSEVNWNWGDFVIAGILLFAGGLAIDLVIRRVKERNSRTAVIVFIVIIFLLIWAELAVGIFGTPFAGS